MKEMTEINKKDINKIFILVDKTRPNENIIAEYNGISIYDENSIKFNYSYIEFKIYASYFHLTVQPYFIVQQIDLPFDITSIINQYLGH